MSPGRVVPGSPGKLQPAAEAQTKTRHGYQGADVTPKQASPQRAAASTKGAAARGGRAWLQSPQGPYPEETTWPGPQDQCPAGWDLGCSRHGLGVTSDLTQMPTQMPRGYRHPTTSWPLTPSLQPPLDVCRGCGCQQGQAQGEPRPYPILRWRHPTPAVASGHVRSYLARSGPTSALAWAPQATQALQMQAGVYSGFHNQDSTSCPGAPQSSWCPSGLSVVRGLGEQGRLLPSTPQQRNTVLSMAQGIRMKLLPAVTSRCKAGAWCPSWWSS